MSNQVIVVGNEKGGVGKTTIAANLAAIAAVNGIRTLLVDADPGQQSSARWAARRREAHPNAAAVRCVSLTSRDIRTELADLAGVYPMIVVDTGALDSQQLRSAAMVAHHIVVPVQPDAIDLWTLPGMATLYARAAAMNPGLALTVALNRIPFQLAASAGSEVRGWLSDNVPALAEAPMAEMVGRTAYGRSTGEGLGVIEMARRDARAEAEIMRLFRMVTE